VIFLTVYSLPALNPSSMMDVEEWRRWLEADPSRHTLLTLRYFVEHSSNQQLRDAAASLVAEAPIAQPTPPPAVAAPATAPQAPSAMPASGGVAAAALTLLQRRLPAAVAPAVSAASTVPAAAPAPPPRPQPSAAAPQPATTMPRPAAPARIEAEAAAASSRVARESVRAAVLSRDALLSLRTSHIDPAGLTQRVRGSLIWPHLPARRDSRAGPPGRSTIVRRFWLRMFVTVCDTENQGKCRGT
jgi:hypothetical protein